MAVGKVVLVLHCTVGNPLAGLGLVDIYRLVKVLSQFKLIFICPSRMGLTMHQLKRCPQFDASPCTASAAAGQNKCRPHCGGRGHVTREGGKGISHRQPR